MTAVMFSAMVETSPDGSFQWADRDLGELMATLLVPDAAGVAIDAVAWAPERPTRWWRLTGLADILGEDALGAAALGDGCARLYSTPAAWVAAADPIGVAVLSWRLDPLLAFAGLARLEVVDRELGERLILRHRELCRLPFRVVEARSEPTARAGAAA